MYSYFQENEDPSKRDTEYTNRGLMECWHDRVPVGVMRQMKASGPSRYKVLGLAVVGGWDGGYFFLEGVALDGSVAAAGPAGELDFLSARQELLFDEHGAFDPANIIDGRDAHHRVNSASPGTADIPV